MALTPSHEVREKLSMDLGKAGGGPSGRAVVREMLRLCLDPAANFTLAVLMGREIPKGVLNVSVTAGMDGDAALLRLGSSNPFSWISSCSRSRQQQGAEAGLALDALCNLLFA